jgi:hypothetical protein
MRSYSRWGLVLLGSCLALALSVLLLFSASGMASADEGVVDLEVTMVAPEHVAPEAVFVINLAYTNNGTADAPDDTQITLTLPDGVQFVQSTDRWGNPLPPDSVDGNQLTWVVGYIRAGDTYTHILITEKLDPDQPEGQVFVNAAEMTSSAVDANLEDNLAAVTTTLCDMAGSTKQVHASEVMPGDVLTYTITLNLSRRESAGSPQFRQVVMTDTLPDAHQVRFMGWVGENRGEMDGQMLRWQGQVQAGEPLQLQYRLGVQGDLASGSVITNGARLSWRNGWIDLEPVSTTVVLPPYARMIGSEGASWQHEYGITIDVPPHAVTETTRFEFRRLFTDTQPLMGPPGWMYAHQAFEVNAFRFAEIHAFGKPITFTVDVTNAVQAGMNQESLRLWYRNGPGDPWQMLGEPTQSGPGYLKFQTTHLTQFALLWESPYQIRLPLLLH